MNCGGVYSLNAVLSNSKRRYVSLNLDDTMRKDCTILVDCFYTPLLYIHGDHEQRGVFLLL